MTRRVDPYQFRACRCECDCREPITKDEARECKGMCIACYGGFHGLQKALRDTGRLSALPSPPDTTETP